MLTATPQHCCCCCSLPEWPAKECSLHNSIKWQLSLPWWLQADIVVLATGYRPTARNLLPEALQPSAGYKGDNQWLYRSVQGQEEFGREVLQLSGESMQAHDASKDLAGP